MIRSSRLRRHPLWRALSPSVLAAGVALLAGPSLASAAAPAKATSFVRGAAAGNGGYPLRAFVGDVNGDGRDDAAFGDATTVSVVYGTSPTADIDLTKDLGSRGFRIAAGSNGLIKDLAAAGDFDRDGIDDLVISTDVTTFVVYGASSTSGTLSLVAGSRITALTGKGANDVEDDVDPIGDFDGDGIDDLALQRGSIGIAIVSGGVRAASIALTSATGRVSHVNSTQRCGFVWFTFKCIYMGVPVEPLGDFDGDGKADLVVANNTNPATYVLYGRTGRFTTTPEAGSGKTTLPNAPAGEYQQEVSPYTGVGDVTGDGKTDALGWGRVIFPGRAGRPSSIASSAPVIRLTSPTISQPNAVAAGDQDGDGLADLAIATGGGSGSDYVLRVLTSFPRTAPATYNVDTAPAVSGVPGDFSYIVGGGDLDGDRLADLLVATVFPGESAYVVSHGTNSPGPGTRFATLEGTFNLIDAAGESINLWSGTMQATCGSRATAKLPLGYPSTVLFTDAQEGDSCVVTAAHTIDNPAAYGNCTWVGTVTHNSSGSATPPTRSFTLAGGANTIAIARRCQLPVTAPPAAFSTPGWLTAGIATQPGAYDRLSLTEGPNQASSLMWPYAVDYRNQTIEFDLRMAGGNGSAEGATVAFVRTGSGGPAGGVVGEDGGLLGFGGLVGSAIAFDVNQNVGDPSSNFIGFTNSMNTNGGLNWLRTASAVVPLRDPAGHRIKIVNRNGTTTVSIDGTVRMTGPLTLPAKTHLAFTASTSATYQYTSAWNLSIKPS